MLRALIDDGDAGDIAATGSATDATGEAGSSASTGAANGPERGDAAGAGAESEPATVPDSSIFRAYDIRGVVGDTLDEAVAESIGRAIGSEAHDRGLTRIAVARDGRLSGAQMLAAVSRGLARCGLEVIEVGAVPTPVLYYAAQEIGGGSGVMVTGSHNPPDYNGFKIVLGGETLSGDAIRDLHTRLVEGRLVHGEGQLSDQRITSRYIERIGTDIQLEKSLKVVVDCGNGIAGAVAPRLLERIGADVIPLYAEVDGSFPNHHPDPGDPKTLEDLRLCVRNFEADVGIAFDGDGDRLGVVAPNGEIIYPDRVMMLFARDVLERNPGAEIIYDVKCTGLLADEIESAGGKPVMARTGHSFIKAEIKERGAPLAGEMSGHFFFGERWYGFDDGLYSAARLLEILAADTRAPGQIFAELPTAVSTPELKVEMKEGEAHAFVEGFAGKAEFAGATISTIDGVRADFADGFGLVRASNTTPVLVLRFEGETKEALARIQGEFRDAMLALNPALKLPF
ncbi:phosphomannomutase/phosphoglucomutase [Halomonas denitrificans]|nr:phosphomannomutase/phosphoglucomutase [Halomonas denitrificans]